MRVLILVAALGFATPSLAQLLPAPQLPAAGWRPQDLEMQQQQEQLRQQIIRQQNELMALEARMRAQQGGQDIEAQKQFGTTPPPQVPALPPNIDLGAMASIPDRALADSNKRVLEASRNQR